jgi:2'-5' RNA ligase
MACAVTLRLDDASAGRVEGLRAALLKAAGETASPPPHPPHITLALIEGAVPAGAMALAARWQAMPVALAGLAVFPGTPPVVWAVPVVTEALLACHAALHKALGAGVCHPHYRVGAWVPHVTLSLDGRLGAGTAIGVAAEAWAGPIEGWLDRAEVVELPAVRVLRGVGLARPG